MGLGMRTIQSLNPYSRDVPYERQMSCVRAIFEAVFICGLNKFCVAETGSSRVTLAGGASFKRVNVKEVKANINSFINSFFSRHAYILRVCFNIAPNLCH